MGAEYCRHFHLCSKEYDYLRLERLSLQSQDQVIDQKEFKDKLATVQYVLVSRNQNRQAYYTSSNTNAVK